MEVQFEVCCGLDVHKKSVAACLRRLAGAGARSAARRRAAVQEATAPASDRRAHAPGAGAELGAGARRRAVRSTFGRAHLDRCRGIPPRTPRCRRSQQPIAHARRLPACGAIAARRRRRGQFGTDGDGRASNLEPLGDHISVLSWQALTRIGHLRDSLPARRIGWQRVPVASAIEV